MLHGTRSWCSSTIVSMLKLKNERSFIRLARAAKFSSRVSGVGAVGATELLGNRTAQLLRHNCGWTDQLINWSSWVKQSIACIFGATDSVWGGEAPSLVLICVYWTTFSLHLQESKSVGITEAQHEGTYLMLFGAVWLKGADREEASWLTSLAFTQQQCLARSLVRSVSHAQYH